MAVIIILTTARATNIIARRRPLRTTARLIVHSPLRTIARLVVRRHRRRRSRGKIAA